MRAMILAAGRGERLRPLTDSCPKPLIPVAGKPLIEYHLERLSEAGFKEVVVNLWYLGDQIRARLGDGQKFGLKIMYSVEKELLNTGGGIKQALPLLGEEPFLLVNGDIYTDYPFERLRTVTLGKGKVAHVVLVDNPFYHPTGDFSLDAEWLTMPQGTKTHTYSGIAVYSPTLYQDSPLGPFSLVPLLKEAIVKRQVTGEHYQGFWYDIGSQERLQKLEAILEVTTK